MKLDKLKLIITLLLCFIAIHAQVVVSSTGGNALGSGGSVCYSVGQVCYTTNIGINGSVAQGVQQPFEISTLSTGLNDANGINIVCSAYPNPATHVLQLKVEESLTFGIQSMSYQLFDNQGKLLEKKELYDKRTNIAVDRLIPATYFLKILQGNKIVKTFKICKL